MPYDDNSSRFDFRQFEDILSQYFSGIQNLSFGQLTTAVQTLDRLTTTAGRQLTVHDVDAALHEQNLSHLPVGTVAALLKTVETSSGQGDVLSRLTVRDLEAVMAQAHSVRSMRHT